MDGINGKDNIGRRLNNAPWIDFRNRLITLPPLDCSNAHLDLALGTKLLAK
jgi:hypothetical protein